MFSNSRRGAVGFGEAGATSKQRHYSYRSASTGSSRAAFTAGQTPKKTPMITDTLKPVISAHDGHLRRQRGHQRAHQHGDQHGDHDSQHAARAGERHGLHQELADDVAAARAQGLAHADLARALGNAHQHDVHHADAAHQQAQRGDGDGHQADQAGDAVELLDDLVGRGDGEIVLRAGGQAADAAHDALHFLESLLRACRSSPWR